MTEKNTSPDAGAAAPKKKPAAKPKTAKAKPAVAKKPATRKVTPPKKAAPQLETPVSEQPSAQAEASQTSDQGATGQSDPAGAAEQADTSSKSKDYDASKMVEDLKGRDWPKIIQRALLMVFFGFLAWITISVAFFLATAQVVISIFVGEPNKALTRLIKQAGNYIRDVLDYLSFASDECPFPFGRDLPEAD